MGTQPFRLTLLGPIRVFTGSGQTVELAPGKPLALLAYLTLAPEPPSRDELASLLWPDSSRKRARGSLRQALWQLRRTLGDDLFTSDDPVALRGGHVDCDVRALEGHLEARRLSEAVEGWTGPPLADLRIADAPGWDRWADDVREELERRLGAALAERGQQDRQAGLDEAAIRWLQAARQVQPSRLGHHLALAEAHLDQRGFDHARDALARARKQFEDDASRERIDELEVRLEAVQGGAKGRKTGRKPALRLRFTGRTEEFGALARSWRKASAGTARVALVTGDAGLGKTRLAEELALLARSDGGRVVRVKAEDSERPIEWGLLGELVDGLLRLSGAAGISPGSTEVLRTVVPSIPQPRAAGGDALPPALVRTRPSAALADALQDLLAAVSEDAPLLVFVDDLHWADTESRAVLARVATRIEEAPVFFLTTSRTGAGDVSPRMRKTLQLLSEASGTTALALRPLSQDETRELLEETLVIPEGADAWRLVERIIRTSRGNPRFVMELLKVLQDHGIVTEDQDGTWRLRPERVPPDLPLPASLRELIDRQLANLPHEASLVAAQLAYASHPMLARLLGPRTGLGQEAVDAGIAELVQRRMIRWEGGDKLAFAHDELRAVVAQRFRPHVGLTTGGGTQWSLFRSAVVATLVLLLASAGTYVLSGGAFRSVLSLGGGPLLIVHGPDSVLEARTPGPSPSTGWTLAPTSDSSLVAAALARAGPGLFGIAPSLDEGNGIASTGDTRRLDLDDSGTDLVSARVLRPDGSLVDARDWEKVHGASWCGGTPPTLLLTVVDDGVTMLVRWDPDAGVVEPVRLHGLPGAVLACSPDGRYGAALTAEGGEMKVQLLDLESGAASDIPAPDPYRIQRLHWETDRPLPIPVAVTLDGPRQRVLEWGERAPLDAWVEYSDGSTSTAALVWTSRDPGVVSVTSEGLLTANRPGDTMVEVAFDGWLSDSLSLRVGETEDNPRVLLWDRVPPLGDDLWVAREPLPSRSPDDVGQEEEPMPRGWISTDAYALPAGGTLELEFSAASVGAPLRACLFRSGVPEAGRLTPGASAAADAGGPPAALCLMILEASDSSGEAELHFHPSFPPIAISIPPRLPGRASRWRHAGIALLPDGTGVAHLDGTEVARTPVRLPPSSDAEWRVLLEGMHPIVEGERRGRGFRNVLLWPDVRF